MAVAAAPSVAESAVTPRLRAGEHYPRTAAEFNAWFADEDACYAYLERLRWPNGIACPGCGETGKVWQISRRALPCVQARDERDRGDDPGGHAAAGDRLVPGRLADHEREERRQRAQPAARA